MQVTDSLVAKLAHLSRLYLTEAEQASMRGELQAMIQFVDKLNELDTSGVQPLMHMGDAQNTLRAEQPAAMLDNQTAIDQAPSAKPPYFSIPKVIRK
ncbi:MAG: Asp-tRNA(Asn)/Glu-tRNA(Gln) amidotransferase subunit GatC [Bacteroidota bacterium]